jgi:predicted restriction endonuclease
MGYKGIKEQPSEKKLLANRETHKKLRQRALDRYYTDPNVCKQCGKIIEVPEGKLIASTRDKQFCNHSCAAIYNNSGRDRWKGKRSEQTVFSETSPCEICGEDIPLKKRYSTGNSYYKRRFCDICLTDLKRKQLAEKAEKNGYTTYYDKIDEGLTFKGLKDLFKDKGYYWFRSIISRHARRTIKENNREFKCEICGFDVQVDVCHRKDVAKFKAEDTILDINSINNLVVLCPNHHIMFDKNIISI